MENSYEAYCIADPVFYDTPTRAVKPEWQFAAADRPPPDGWDRFEYQGWVQYRPRQILTPAQGWKIHVSATLENADDVLDTVCDYCFQRPISFKFLHDKQILLFRNAKSADRGASGKFVTIYPRDESELESVLIELGARLSGQQGPYILSDLRWGSGPLYVRYGGFASRWLVGANGEREPAIEDPTGNLVPDRRQPTFAPPSWVSLPEFLRPHLESRNSVSVADLPYRIEAAIHFSNIGGIYRALDERSGKQFVLKEARPYAGLAGDGTDAVARLQRERQILTRLSGLECVPMLHDYLTVGEHHYLVQDYVDGSTLNSVFVGKYPLVFKTNEAEQLAEYAAWAGETYRRVERAVAAVHERGVVIGDINGGNIFVRSSGEIALIDWEVAQFSDEERRRSLAAPDFAVRSDLRGYDIDHHSLALLRLFLFLPLTALIGLDRRKAEEFGETIVALFPCDPGFISEAVDVIGRADAGVGFDRKESRRRCSFRLDSDAWPILRESMARAILASASADRDDRLFPGDPKQFDAGGGINLAYGAAGVLFALNVAGAGRFRDHEAWLVDHSLEARNDAPLGFYDGLSGVAYVLDRLGRRDDALEVMQACMKRMEEALSERRYGLLDGLAGIGLNLAYFGAATGDDTFTKAAGRIVEVVAANLGSETDVAEVSGGDHPYAGLIRGAAGPALLFIRWFERTGDPKCLDLAHTALRQDLRRCVLLPDNSLQVDESWRTMPYVADGSVGIGMVLEDYLAHRSDERFLEAAAAIRLTASSRFFVLPGLFSGRAGMVLHLSRARPAEPGIAQDVADQVGYLSWHAIYHDGNLAFPGDQLLRLSMDFATGTAGVLFALGAALGEGEQLPFVGGLGPSRCAG